jgi:leader peptidase (prepilin peptidase) / N-methyltransferase
MDIPTVLISILLFLASFLRFGLNMIFIKAVVLSSILVVVSVIDLKHQIIPDRIVIITLIIGILSLLIGDISLKSSLLGMITGGSTLFLLAMIPGAMGGGDIKLMFAVGSFLGFEKTLWALLLAFIIASIVSLLLLLFRIKKGGDKIPFGPFLAAGSLISLLLF